MKRAFREPAGRPLNFPAPGGVVAVKGGVGGTSRFKGVSWHTKEGKWRVQINVEGKNTTLGSFANEELAARAYDEAAARMGRPLNFPSSVAATSLTTTSAFRGVSWNKKDRKWRVVIRIDGKRVFLGNFVGEEEAARAYDEAAAKIGRPVIALGASPAAAAPVAAAPPAEPCEPVVLRGPGITSQYKGVNWDKSAKKWKVQIKIDTKKTTIGRFDDEEAAARAYDRKAAPLGRPLNFPADGCMRAVKGGRGGTSHFKGVSWDKRCGGKWLATIRLNGASTSLGLFDDEEAAARRYDAAAAGARRPLNFPGTAHHEPSTSAAGSDVHVFRKRTHGEMAL